MLNGKIVYHTKVGWWCIRHGRVERNVIASENKIGLKVLDEPQH
jgi:hypothetical protein